MTTGPAAGMCSVPSSRRPKYILARPRTPGRKTSRNGVRTGPRVQKTGTGVTSGPRLPAPAMLFVVFAGPDLDLGTFELTPVALDPILAANARLDFRHRPQPRRADGLSTLDARAIVAVPQVLERGP